MVESKGAKLDRELNELLQELRVLLPGVQVLFAFLLTLPFTVGFEKTSDGERCLFFLTLLSTATSAVLLVAPGVRHRSRFRDHDKEALIQSGNRLSLVATVFLALAVTMATTLIAEYLYDWTVGAVTALFVLTLTGWFWYGWSISRGLKDRAGS